jgi:hypothetical protein
MRAEKEPTGSQDAKRVDTRGHAGPNHDGDYYGITDRPVGSAVGVSKACRARVRVSALTGTRSPASAADGPPDQTLGGLYATLRDIGID